MDADLIAAARSGDHAALESLVSHYLPLVYNIVGRALPSAADVDDVVQETMLRVVRGLSGLRDPGAFRSWLVAVAMNQVRDHHHRLGGRPRPLDEMAEVADPGADFADLTLTELGLTGQRREVAQATAWLDPDDRELLSLWWLVEAGHLTRGELVAAIGLEPHHVTVRIARMKAQLETSRGVVRALSATPCCLELADAALGWHGRPEPLWRKRFARHIRQCHICSGLAHDFVPAERLLVRLSLVPLPIGLADAVHSHLPRTVRPLPGPRARHSHRRIPQARAARAGQLATKLAIGAATTAAVVGAIAVTTGGASTKQSTQNQPNPFPPTTAGIAPTPSASLDASTAMSSPTSSTGASPSPDPTRSSSRPTPTHATTSSITSPSPANNQASPEDQVLAVINQARAQQGLAPLTRTTGLHSSAAAHTNTMASGCGLQHQCPGEAGLGDRISAAGVSWSAVGENIGEGGPVSNTNSAIADMAVGLTKDMLAEQPPNDGHRRNILSSSYHHIGISIFRDSSGTVWMTQDFSD